MSLSTYDITEEDKEKLRKLCDLQNQYLELRMPKSRCCRFKKLHRRRKSCG